MFVCFFNNWGNYNPFIVILVVLSLIERFGFEMWLYLLNSYKNGISLTYNCLSSCHFELCRIVP